MQIVAGRFRHRKLETNPGDSTRPILTRVKIALFDRLQPLLAGARVADVYSGTGTIGLEALSRGAVRVVFYEQDRRAFDLLRENIASLRVEDETICWRVDVTKCSFRPKNSDGFLPYDMVFFDPPYAHLEKLARGTMLYRSLERLSRPGISAPDARLVVRCATGTKFAMPEAWKFEELLEYSSMDVHLFQKVPALADQSPPEADPIEGESASIDDPETDHSTVQNAEPGDAPTPDASP